MNYETIVGALENIRQSLVEASAELSRLNRSIEDKDTRLKQILMDYYGKTRNQVQRSMAKVFKSNKLIANICSLAAAFLCSTLAGFFSYSTLALKGVPIEVVVTLLLLFFISFYIALRYLARGLAMFGLRVDFNEGKSINRLFTLVRISGLAFFAAFAALLAAYFLLAGGDLVIVAQIGIELSAITFSGSCAVLASFFDHVFKLHADLETDEIRRATVQGNLANLQQELFLYQNQLARFQPVMMEPPVPAMLPRGVGDPLARTATTYDYVE